MLCRSRVNPSVIGNRIRISFAAVKAAQSCFHALSVKGAKDRGLPAYRGTKEHRRQTDWDNQAMITGTWDTVEVKPWTEARPRTCMWERMTSCGYVAVEATTLDSALAAICAEA